MGVPINLTNKRFGSLVVIEKHGHDKHGSVMWLCKCDCGGSAITTTSHLMSGHTKSCGCGQRLAIMKTSYVHGGTHDRLYATWNNIKRRCYAEKQPSYKDYGGRGIKMCDEWRYNYEAFKTWAYSHGYDDSAKPHGCSIDRIDVNGDYCPENCRWVGNIEQANNKRDNRMLTVFGETLTMADAARKYGINYGTLNSRVNALHWSAEKALSVPVQNCGKRRFHPKDENSFFYKQETNDK